MNNDVEILKNQPNLDQLRKILDRNIDKISLPYINALLEYNIPEIFPNEKVNEPLTETFQSLIGLGNLLNRLSIYRTDKKSAIYLQFLSMVINQNLLFNLQRNSTPVINKEIEKLLFKGRLLSTINEAREGKDSNNPILNSTSSYVAYLIDQVRINNSYDFIPTLMKLNNDAFIQTIDSFFDEQNWEKFISLFNTLNSFEKRNIVRKLYTLYLPKAINDLNLLSLYNILSFTSQYIDESTIEKIISKATDPLNTLTAMIVVDKQAMILKILHKWSDDNFIKNEPISIQRSRTFLLCNFIFYMKGSEFLRSLTSNQMFIHSISNRLGSYSNNVKGFAIILADYVCEINGDEKIFNLDSITDYDKFSLSPPELQKLSDPWKNIQRENSTRMELKVINKEIKEMDRSIIDEDLPADKVANPIYVKDLIEYLNVDTSNKNAYEMRRMALEQGPTLLRQKALKGSEVEFYSEELLSTIIALDNFFNMNNFEDLKLNFMVSIIVSTYKVTNFMFELLVNADYSLQQRLFILSATSLSARDLRGIKDEIVTNSYEQKEFSTKTLPKNLHNSYLKLENPSKHVMMIENELQNSLMNEESEKAQDKLINKGKVLRMSSKLTKQTSSPDKPKTEDFFQIIGTHFYFPLLSIWYKDFSRIRNLGHYTSIFIAHYLKTLTMLIHVAYPSSLQLLDMTKEYLILSMSIIKGLSIDEIQVVESLITGWLLILDIFEDEKCVSTFNQEILFITNWLISVFDMIIDEKVKSLAAGLLLKLTELTKKFERTIIDEQSIFS